MLFHAEGFGKAEKGPKKMYVKVMCGRGGWGAGIPDKGNRGYEGMN